MLIIENVHLSHCIYVVEKLTKISVMQLLKCEKWDATEKTVNTRDYVKEIKRKRVNKLKGYKRIGEAECQTG